MRPDYNYQKKRMSLLGLSKDLIKLIIEKYLDGISIAALFSTCRDLSARNLYQDMHICKLYHEKLGIEFRLLARPLAVCCCECFRVFRTTDERYRFSDYTCDDCREDGLCVIN